MFVTKERKAYAWLKHIYIFVGQHAKAKASSARRVKAARKAETDAEKEERRAANADRQKALRSAERLAAGRWSTTLARAAFSYATDKHYVADHALSTGSVCRMSTLPRKEV